MPEKGPVTLREEDLDFSFDATWQVCSQWDKEGAYGDLKAQASGSKGVDFVGLRGRVLYLIEVKDYRTFEHQSSTREKLEDDQLVNVVAGKVRDTVAGLVGAARMERDPAWKACIASLVGCEMCVVLWIEHAAVDASSPVRATRATRAKAEAGVLQTSLKKRCRWISARALVCSRSGDPVPGLDVHSIAGAARMRGRQP